MTETKNATFRSACLTIFNVTDYSDIPCGDKIQYFAYGRETCPSTGREHFQAFAYAKTPMRLTQWKKVFPGAHIEPMKGSFADNSKYCSKQNDLIEFGERPMEHGKHKCIENVKRKLDEGLYHMDIAEENIENFVTIARHSKFIEKYEHHVRSKKIRADREMPKVYIRIGDSGTGKTRWLDEQFGFDGWARMPNPTSSWWITPAVSRSDTVLIDDVGPKKVPKVEEFLEWTDRYPVEFNSKGGFLWWKPKNIIITSNCSWDDWWPDLMPSHKAAVERRIYRVDLVFKDRPVESFYPNGLQEEVRSQELIEGQEDVQAPPL